MGSMGIVPPASEPIAVIGLSCKFAGDASNPEALWQLLAEKRSAWSEIPSSRFNAKGAYHPNPEKLGTTNVIGGHFINEDIALFDAPFFNLSAEYAAALDPQFRLQLESAYEALENAGIPLASVAGSKTSVYAGLWKQDYKDNLMRDEDNLPRYCATGTGSSFAANRISHFFDLRGASMTIDTACSTSLVALHQAVQSLRNRESDMAIVGGSNLMLNPDTFKTVASAGFLSADGKSYAFDSRANGYGRGEGAATIIVKRLVDALAAGDPVRAVVRETAVNQDGKTESITTPSQAAQVELMRECYQRAEIDPRDTQYFEAHGTGTFVGDPIEAGAVAAVFQKGRSAEQALRLGSVKTNIGHTEVTSGLAGIIKVILAMEKCKIPPSINFKKSNEKIPLDKWKLKLVRDVEEWSVGPGGVKRASINNFGYGGTNAHVVMEDGESWMHRHTESTSRPGNESRWGVLVLSAKTEKACENMVANLRKYLDSHDRLKSVEEWLETLIYTLGQRRSVFSWIATHPVSLTSGLDDVKSALDSPQFKVVRTSRPPRIGFVFTGQGAQWHAMGLELISGYPTFRESLEDADLCLGRLGAKWSLLKELQRDAEHSRVNDASISIPICVALQIALVQLLRAWGIIPTAVTSHSSGEIAAAYAVGALNMESAMAVAYHRTVLTADENLHRTIEGGMVAVGIGVEQTKTYLAKLTGGNKATAACINSPSSVTVAGDVSAVQEIEDMMKADGIFARRLRVDTAYHSHHMESVAEPYRKTLSNSKLAGESIGEQTSIKSSSPVTGGRILDADQLSQPGHWVDSMVQPVLFLDAFQDMILGDFDPSGSSVDVIVEIGPHTALGSGIKEIMALPAFNSLQLPYYGCIVRNTDARYSMQHLAAKLLREGQPLDMAAINFPHKIPQQIGLLTDLPSYPWAHQTRYWQESRFNRAIRNRSRPQHEFLGSVASWANPASPSWRQIVRADDNSWLRDHVVESSIVYPGAGFVCLAIEAMSQMATIQGDDRLITGFRLRDIQIQMALVVPDTADGIEIQIILSSVGDKAVGSQDCKKFEVVSTTAEGKWTQHAHGEIVSEFESVDMTTIANANNKPSGYTRSFDPEDFYTNLRRIGLKQGPNFQNIRSIVYSPTEDVVTTFVIADTDVAENSPSHLIHPTTLTSIVQAAYTALPRAGSQLENAMMPTSIQKLWVSSQISHEPGHLFKASTSLGRADRQSVRANVSVTNGNEMGMTSPVVKIEGLMLQSFGGGVSPGWHDKPWEKDVCSKLEWALDMSLATLANVRSIKHELARSLDPKETDTIMDLRRTSIYFMHDALTALCPSEVQQLHKHNKKYYSWLKAQVDLAAAGQLGPGSSQWVHDNASERQDRIEAARSSSANGEMVCQLGPHLAAILCGKQAPLELMMEDRLLYKYYKNMLKIDRSFEHTAALLKQLVHKNPRARILEIGAGTGGGTRYMLPTLGTTATGGPLASIYHFTDVSAGFFAAATEEFSDWTDLLQFDKLDVEMDPASQGFEMGGYDIVIACQVLHATKSMADTMMNVRKLMKPGGTLLLVETTKDQVDVQFVFGLLPGWWLSEEKERQSSPSLSIPFWHQILQGAGFTGVDLELHDCESEDMYSMSTIMSTSLPTQPPRLPPGEDVVIVTSNQNPPQQGWLDSLLDNYRGSVPERSTPTIHNLGTASTGVYAGKVCICIAEAAAQPVLHNLDPVEWEGIKAMATACKGLLWITRGGLDTCEKPEFGLAAGLLRTLRNEYVGRQFLALDFDPTTPVWSDLCIPAIVQVLETCFGDLSSPIVDGSSPKDFEYMERNGSLLVPRFFKDIDRRKAIFFGPIDYSAPESIPVEPFQQPARPISLQVGIPGMLDTLVFADDERSCCQSEALAADMVEINPRAFGVNSRDVMAANGQVDDRVMGLECAGTITKVGVRAASQGFAIGDPVMCLLLGPFSSRVYTEWTKVVAIPASLSFEEAASIPFAFTTAYYCLNELARLKCGQSILIHAAAEGVGQAAIVLAQHVGATVFATVSSPEKRALLIKDYGIAAEHIFSSRDILFAQGVLAATDGRGVDVILNSLAGPLMQASLNLLAPFGHLIEIGKSDLERNSSLEMLTFAQHASFSSVDMLAMLRLRGDDVSWMLAEVTRLAVNKVVRLIKPLTVYPISQATKAFQHLETGKHPGKVVMSISPEERVGLVPRRPKVRLSASASYLLVGEIGQSITIWMIEHGAKNLILLSNSPEEVDSMAGFAAQIQQAGCRVKATSCDVSNSLELQQAFEVIQHEEFPPIRGIIYGGMNRKVRLWENKARITVSSFRTDLVLEQDSILEEMSFQDYNSAIVPNISGTWNIHCQFPVAHELDFFVLLSSNIGILGNAGQASHAAGQSYRDAFARWRVARGLPCVSIDLPMVKSFGTQEDMAEEAGMRGRMAKLGHSWLDEYVMGDVLESAILQPRSQIIIGINGGPGPHWDGDSPSQLGRDARFIALQYGRQKRQQNGKRNRGDDNALINQLAEATSRAEAEVLVGEAMGRKLSDIFAIPMDDVDMTKAPTEYGVDSLVAVELRNMLMHQVGSEVASFDILQSASLGKLAIEATAKSRHVSSELQ
ncbi:MAG: hypothetical protein Q9204_001021 [Flavoplaca sp. TL-2023a]